jgi:Fur family ferric uptake transcriptional regulator
LLLTVQAGRADIPAVSAESTREKFQAYLTEKGLRVTDQRLAIFNAAFAQKEHFTAEQLLDCARKIDDSVSRATVYRTLPLMTESAILREVDIGTGEKYYLPATGGSTQVAQVSASTATRFSRSAPRSWNGMAAPSRSSSASSRSRSDCRSAPSASPSARPAAVRTT